MSHTYKNIVHILQSASIIFLLTFSLVNAQADLSDIPRMNADEVSIEFSPEYPDAFSPVAISLRTFSIDLDLHFVTWYINGERFDAGFGRDTIQITTGDYGENVRITADISLQDNTTVTKNISLQPNVVDLIWEAIDSYTPPFYKGKALPTRGGLIKFSALPYVVNNNQSLRPTQLAYTWDWEYKTIGDRSGFAKDSFIIETNIIRNQERVSVEARTTSGDYSARSTNIVELVDPELDVYATNKLPRELIDSTFSTVQNQTTLQLVPYFFATGMDNNLAKLNYSWKINESPIEPPVSPFLLPVSINSPGRIELEATVRDPKFRSTRATNNFNVNLIE